MASGGGARVTAENVKWVTGDCLNRLFNGSVRKAQCESTRWTKRYAMPLYIAFDSLCHVCCWVVSKLLKFSFRCYY